MDRRRIPLLLLLPLVLTACGGPDGRAEGETGAVSVHPLAEPYLDVAFGNRWGGAPAELRKRTRPLAVRLAGEPRYEDRLRLRRLVAELDEIPNLVDLELVEWEDPPPEGGPGDGRNVLEIAYLPSERFGERVPDRTSGYPAVFSCPPGDGPVLGDGLILLPAGEDYPQYMRDNLLLEGVMACLGLAGGLDEPHESVFQSEPNWYEGTLLPLDRDLLALHYRPELAPGISRARAAWRLGMDGEAVGPEPAAPKRARSQ